MGDKHNLCALLYSWPSRGEHSGPGCPVAPTAHLSSRSVSLAILSRGTISVDLTDSTSAFISSRSRFSFARRFWNQVITCAFVSPSWWAIWSLSAGDKYFWWRNLFSSSYNWWLLKAVLDFRRFLGLSLWPNWVNPSLPVDKRKWCKISWHRQFMFFVIH